MKIDVLAVGELLADIISEQYVTSLSGVDTFKLYQGGSPANVCANLQWMGNHAVMVSCVGADGIGDFLLNAIEKIGLSTDYVARSESHHTSIVLVGRSQQTPDFIAYRMADTQIGPVDKSLIEQSSVVHSCAFALSRNPAQRNILDAFDFASSIGKRISIDWNFAPTIWGDDGESIFAKVCESQPLLKMSQDDIDRFLGKSVSIDEALVFLSSLTTSVVCLTCGKDGVWFRDNQGAEWKFLKALAVPDVKDTTGAGDAFWSGFLNAYLRNEPTAACVERGLRIAAQKVQRMGPLYFEAIHSDDPSTNIVSAIKSGDSKSPPR